MEIKNLVEIGGITMELKFDFETLKVVKTTLIMPQIMDGADLMDWKKRYHKEIKIAKNHPELTYYYALSSANGLLAIGINSQSEQELRTELLRLSLLTDLSKKEKQAMTKRTLAEMCSYYNYTLEKSLVPFVLNMGEELYE